MLIAVPMEILNETRGSKSYFVDCACWKFAGNAGKNLSSVA